MSGAPNSHTHDELAAVLDDIEEFLEDQQDVVDGSYGDPHPNKAMSLLGQLQAARVSETGTTRDAALEEAAKVCDAAEESWIESCQEGSETQAYEDVVLRNAASSIRALKNAAPQVAQAARPEAAEAARTPVGAATPNTHAEAWAHRSGLMEGALSRLLTALVTHPSPDIHNAVDNAKEILKTPQVGDDQRNAPWSSHGSAAMWHNRDGRTVEPVGNDLIGGKWRWAA